MYSQNKTVIRHDNVERIESYYSVILFIVCRRRGVANQSMFMTKR